MSYFSFRNIPITLNNQKILAENISLSQEAFLINPFKEGDKVSFDNLPTNPIKGILSLSYLLTGHDFLKNYISVETPNYLISGNIGGLIFKMGVLGAYNFDSQPNSPISINATIPFFDELSGSFSSSAPISAPNNINTLRTSNISFDNFSSPETLNNISNISYSYNAEVKGIYYQYETGIPNLQADRILFGPKQISAQITCDSINPTLPLSGQDHSLRILCNHPTNTGFFEDFYVSGKINKKDFSVGAGQTHKTTISITQSNIGSPPIISSVVLSGTYTTGIQILSPINSSPFISRDGTTKFIQKVTIGDISYPFLLERIGWNDQIIATVPLNAVNGNLVLDTSKGTVVYPNPIALVYPPIVVSGFFPQTGSERNVITISGINFNKVNHVYFGAIKTNFQLQTTGNPHTIIASVPANAKIDTIKLISDLRNRTGITSGLFYPQPVITTFNPATGIFGNIITISGYNFSGITNVFFSGKRSPSINNVSSNTITAQVPAYGSGYTRGPITVIGTGGMVAKSNTVYEPHIPITLVTPTNGLIGSIVHISGIIDTGFLFPQNGGFRIAFGNNTGTFYVESTGSLSGIMPSGFFGTNYVYLYKPDGVGRYSPYTGIFTQLGPQPIIYSIEPSTINLYKFYNITVLGNYLKDFITPNYCQITGIGLTGIFNQISGNFFYTKLIVRNVRITEQDIISTESSPLTIDTTLITVDSTTITVDQTIYSSNLAIDSSFYHTGKYDFRLYNIAGADKTIPTQKILIVTGIDEARRGVAFHAPTGNNYARTRVAALACDGNPTTYSSTEPYEEDGSGIWQVTFRNPIPVSKIRISQIGVPTRRFNTSLSTTGHLNLYATGNILLSGISGISLINYTNTWSLNPFLNVAKIKITSSGTYPNLNNGGYLGFNRIEVY